VLDYFYCNTNSLYFAIYGLVILNFFFSCFLSSSYIIFFYLQGVFGARAAPREVAVAPAEPISGRASARPVPAAPAPEVSARPSAGERGGMGRGASRGRQEREVAIYTRPSKDFDKRGNFNATFKSCLDSSASACF
jgi:hypothetical protein